MQPSSDTPKASTGRQLRRYGPIVGIVAVIAVVAVAVVVGGGGDDGTTTTTAAGSVEPPAEAISWSRAEEEGLELEWGEGCDQETGRVALPYYFAPECYAEIDDNGGATARGVTADAITVVIYIPQDDDLILDFITSALGIDDNGADVEATYRGFVEMFEAYYQTYGRRVDVKILHGTGGSADAVTARADAVTAAEMEPFAVWGGPVLTTAWADELAARGVICLGCSAGGNAAWFEERAPYVYGITKTAEQNRLHLVEYVTKRVAGRPAAHAGDPAFQSTRRRFGLLYLESSEDSTPGAQDLQAQLAEKGVTLEPIVPYTLDPTRLQEQADSAIARLKDAGVTSVLISGDPVAPGSFTRAATAQGYHPEWILSGSALMDTTAFARTYDQEQWAHAFGVSQLTARTRPEIDGSYFLYDWFHGEPPPADDSVGVLFPQPGLFYSAVQAAGPSLTPETFRDGLFAGAPTPDAITNPSISFGDHGIWPDTDYSGIDDATELWWDAAATGPDEIRREGQGMYQYGDGGRRYLPGAWPESDTRAFDPEGAVALYDELPESEARPDYPPPGG